MTLLQAAALPSVPFLAYWREIGLTLAAFGAVIAFVSRAVFDKQFTNAFTRNKRDITGCLDDWYKERIDRNTDTASLGEANRDRLIAFEASLMQQGVTLQTQLGQYFTSNTAALVAVQKEAQATAQAVARIEGIIDANEWTGAERRSRVRRKPGSGQ